jgi:hypothetical protein
MKTLEEAIVCWTVTREYNSLKILANSVKKSACSCRSKTLRTWSAALHVLSVGNQN